MSSAKAKALLACYALSGSHNTSWFSGTGNKSACAKWSIRPALTTTLCHLVDRPETPSSDDIAVSEIFVISSYSVYSIVGYLPATKAALLEHVK